MCSSYKAIGIIKQSDISNHELSVFLNNVLKEALVDYLIFSRLPINLNKILKNKMIELIINDRVLTANNDIDMLAIDVNKLNVFSKQILLLNSFNRLIIKLLKGQ